MRRLNLDALEFALEHTRPGFRWRGASLNDTLGSTLCGASVYEIEAGERTFPYHFHYGIEEWLYVLAGAPLLRSADGERRLATGELIRFPSGPTGAHTVTGPGRVMIFGDRSPSSICAYPDSDKIGPRPKEGPADRLNFRRGDAVDYWEGE